jgi:hypothetical protein
MKYRQSRAPSPAVPPDQNRPYLRLLTGRTHLRGDSSSKLLEGAIGAALSPDLPFNRTFEKQACAEWPPGMTLLSLHVHPVSAALGLLTSSLNTMAS